jgi:hypothetical protein
VHAASAPTEGLRERIRVKALGHTVRADRRCPQTVVLAPLLLVGENRVGLIDLLEAFGFLLVPAGGVGVILLGQLAVRLLERVLARIFGNTKDFVEVLHRSI